MKRKTTYTLIIVALIAVIVLILVLNKRSTAAKTAMIEDFSTDVAVRTEVVSPTDYAAGFETNGLLEAKQDLSFVSDIGGRVLQVLADEGDRVHKGQVLIRLDSETLRADVESARTAYEAAQRDYERFKSANAQGGVTDQQLSTIHTQMVAAESRYIASRRRLSDASIKSPLTGKIYKRYVEVGSFLNPGLKLFDIIDDSSLKAMSYLTEKQRLQVHPGDTVTMTSELYPGSAIPGVVTFVSNKADRSLNFPVEVRVTDSPVELLPGMYVSIAFLSEADRQGILIPRSAIIGSVRDAHVYRVEESTARETPVVAGQIVGERIEILDGLQQGDSIIVGGLINIADGTVVKNVE
jgi:RND family efflux transporter MFP subunit